MSDPLRRPLLVEAVNQLDPLFTDDQLATLGKLLDSNPRSARVAGFSGYIPEAQAACDFLPKLASVKHPAIPDPDAIVPPLV